MEEGEEVGLIPQEEIIFVEELAQMLGFEPMNMQGPNADQMQAFLNDSFIFMFKGFKGVGPEPEQVQIVLAMPSEAVMFMIAQVMQRIQLSNPQIVMSDPNIPPPGFPPAGPGGLIIPGN